MTPWKPGPDLLGGLEGSPGEIEVGCASQWGQGQVAEAPVNSQCELSRRSPSGH